MNGLKMTSKSCECIRYNHSVYEIEGSLKSCVSKAIGSYVSQIINSLEMELKLIASSK